MICSWALRVSKEEFLLWLQVTSSEYGFMVYRPLEGCSCVLSEGLMSSSFVIVLLLITFDYWISEVAFSS